jgi:hypothetical protein
MKQGIIGVFVTGFILKQTDNNWVVVFMVTASLCGLSWILWLLFVHTEFIDFDRNNQQWAPVEGEDPEDNALEPRSKVVLI